MGYACPVCEAPQTDGEHLANHLAFTAMLRQDEHEEWLDEHVDDWAERSPEELAPDVTPHAPETDVETVFEDTTGDHDHSHGHGHGHGEGGQGHGHGEGRHGHGGPGQFEDEIAQHGGYGRDSITSLSGEDQQIVDEAREMTRQMLESEDEDSEDAEEERVESAESAEATADEDTESE